jgi:organic radical activating enzyme
MTIERENLYRFPWSKTDNPGSWVEVTDECDLSCPGCYRYRLEGHRPFEEVKNEIIACQRMTNCDRIAISGGEPLIYPHIIEVVEFISRQRMKPMLLTNGEKLTWELALALKEAGLVQFYFHVDSGQQRPGWTGKNEAEMNKLRQHYADLVWELGGVQCGYNVTVFRSTLKYIPEIVEWTRSNINKVQHLSLITFRGFLLKKGMKYMVDNKTIDMSLLQNSSDDSEEISITTDEMFRILENHFPGQHPCAYLSGTTAQETYKFLIILNVGSRDKIYGGLGARTVELVQVFHHLFKGKYCAFLKNQKVGKKIFILSLLDREVKKAFVNFLKAFIRNPSRIFDGIYMQCINLQQPNEFFKGKKNLCDGCLNMMIYKGELINSCQLDEYRLFGGPVSSCLDKN